MVEDIKYDGRILETLEAVDILKNRKLGKGWMEGSLGGMSLVLGPLQFCEAVSLFYFVFATC